MGIKGNKYLLEPILSGIPCKCLRFTSRGGTPRNSWWWCAARFSKSLPYFRPNNEIFYTRFQTRPLKSIPVFRPGLQAEIMSSILIRLERKQKNSLNAYRICIFLSRFYSFEIETITTYVHTLPQFPRKPYPIPDQNGQNGVKTPPDGAAHTHIAYIREYPPRGVYVIVPHTERRCPVMKRAFVQGTNWSATQPFSVSSRNAPPH